MATTRSKTVAFPRFDLKKCESRIMKIPPAKPLTRDEILEMIGYTNPTSGPAGSAIGALTMFGLVHKENDMFELTALGKALRAPISNSQKRLVRIIAWLLPQRFQDFYTILKGKKVKSNGIVKSMMSQKHSVSDEVARKFDRVFINSGVHASAVLELSDDNYRIMDIDPIFAFLNQDPGSLNCIPDDIFDKTVDEEVCNKVLEAIDQPASKDVSEKDIGESKEAIEYTSALSGDHDLIQFKLSDGVYIVSKSDLEEFIRTNGKKVSEELYSLNE